MKIVKETRTNAIFKKFYYIKNFLEGKINVKEVLLAGLIGDLADEMKKKKKNIKYIINKKILRYHINYEIIRIAPPIPPESI